MKTKKTKTTPTQSAPAAPDATLLAELIRQRAYELWEAGGRQPGHDLTHWFEAERQVREQTGLNTIL